MTQSSPEPKKPKQLRDRSIHELRGMAQAFGVHDIFEKDAQHLIQEIELKQQGVATIKQPLPPMPEYDARLMTEHPAKQSDHNEMVSLLEPYIRMGLRVTFDDNGEHWHMQYGVKTDSGTMRMPLWSVLGCARELIR